ncbi:MAG: ORF6N domain-containing protein [Acidaminococcaceae bacterium]|nr:ORF6N domain-containing protein [Acidaminococcaceae bacterium]
MFFFFNFDKNEQADPEQNASPEAEGAKLPKPKKNTKAKEAIPALPAIENQDIKNLIYTIRGKQVMLDSDLASLYGYEVKKLNQQVKRNIDRFPEDFMFQLLKEEIPDSSKSQIVTLNESGNKRGSNVKKLPYAFTEQGIYMLSTVLRGELAVKQSIFIMRAFREMRHFIANNAFLLDRVSKIELKQLEADKKFEQIFDYISDHKEHNQKLFFDGQIYDAFSLLASLIRKAAKEIILVDGYIDLGTLNILTNKQPGVVVTVYTRPNTKLKAQDISMFNAQYPQLTVKHTKLFHDRFLILDRKTFYHIGASLKDAGKSCFGVSLFEDGKKELLQKLNSIK